MSWLARKLLGGGLILQPGVYINEDYTDNHTPVSAGLSTNLSVGMDGVLHQTASGQWLRLPSADVWPLYSPFRGQSLVGDFDFELELKTQRKYTIQNQTAWKVTFDTPDAAVTYPRFFIDSYQYSSTTAWRTPRLVANETLLSNYPTMSSGYDNVTEMVIRLTRRSNVLRGRVYRLSDMAIMTTLNGYTMQAQYNRINNILAYPAVHMTAGTDVWLRRVKLTTGGVLFPAGI